MNVALESSLKSKHNVDSKVSPQSNGQQNGHQNGPQNGSNGGGDDGQNAVYNKYRKMLKIRMPKQSIINRMIQDGVDKAVIARFESEGILPGNAAAKRHSENESNSKQSAEAMAEPITAPKKDEWAKYRKMVKIRMPKQSVINRMVQDGIDRAIIDQFESSGQFPKSGAPATAQKVGCYSFGVMFENGWMFGNLKDFEVE